RRADDVATQGEAGLHCNLGLLFDYGRFMRWIFAIALVSCALSATANPANDARDGDGAARTMPRPAILMFWAAWCAPCRLELDHLPELTAAAGAVPIVVIPIDASARTRETLRALPPPQVAYPAGGAYALLDALIGGAAGLPVNLELDANGAVCARKMGPLRVADIRAWAEKCARLPVSG
ncbi:MAG: hypothetical protein JOZ27_02470, partial [Caulobacteraceae bacterium]|nr:hypothetical protein [Caulobacteraceae bacterium]